MWEHEFKTLKRKDSNFKQFIREREPPFYRTHRWKTSESSILTAVREDKFFGFLEVDIHVPDHLKEYFEEMSPLFAPS